MQPRKFNIVTDGAWGSCGKGLITTALAWKHRPQIISTTNMANAGHCQTADTYVITDRGLERLGSVVLNRTASQTVNMDGNFEMVSHHHYDGVRHINEIALQNGVKLRCTDAHRYYVWDIQNAAFRWVASNNLNADHHIFLFPKEVAFPNNKLLPDRWSMEPLPNRTIITLPPDSTKTDVRFAEYLGLLVGDGYYAGLQKISIAFHSDRLDVAETVADLYRDMGITAVELRRVPGKRYSTLTTRQTSGLNELFKIVGLDRATKSAKRTPSGVLRSNKLVIAAYLRGLFDADGSVKKDRVQLTNCSRVVVEDAQQMLYVLGIHSCLSVYHCDRPIKSGVRLPQFILSVSGKADLMAFHRTVGFLSRVKTERLLGLVGQTEEQGLVLPLSLQLRQKLRQSGLAGRTNTRTASVVEKLANSTDPEIVRLVDLCRDYHPVRIKSIRLHCDQAEVFDITVPGTHSYLANGCVSHNTAVFTDGRTFVAKALPSATILTKWLTDYQPQIVVGPTAAFDLDQMMKEIHECGVNHSLTIHPRAGVITEAHKLAESGNGEGSTKHIASTMQGCGAFLADKILRKKGLRLARDYPELNSFMADYLPRKLTMLGAEAAALEGLSLPEMLYRLMTRHGYTILHEGSQGFSLDINHGSHYPQCHHIDTLVRVRTGDGVVETIRLQNVDVSRHTEIEDIGGWVRLHKSWENLDPEPMLAIVAGQNLLMVTAGHPTIIERDGVRVEIRADAVRPGDRVYTPTPNRPVANKALGRSLAYAVGYFLGDGWISGEMRPAAHRPTAGQKKTTELARYRARKQDMVVETPTHRMAAARKTQMLGVIFSSQDFYRLPGHLDRLSLTHHMRATKSKAFRLNVWSSDFARQLDSMGIKSELAPNKRLMPDYLDYDDVTLAMILAGYIDSDGTVTKTGRVVFEVTSLCLCQQWQRWLHSLGIKCSIRPRKKYGTHYSTHTTTDHWLMSIVFHKNQTEHPVYQTLLAESAKAAIRLRPQARCWDRDATHVRSAFSGGLSKVTRIVRLGLRRAWDVTTDTGTFLAGGILAHNCTSRGTTGMQNMADMGISHFELGDVYLVIRPYPIRVGNVIENGQQVGYSGDCYDGQEEITWEQVAKESGMPDDVAASLLKKELTTVTKRLRRVFTFSDRQLREAALINGATKIALNFANYIDYSVAGKNQYDELTPKVKDFIARVEDVTKLPVTVVGTGPQVDHVVLL
jgi:adenylosuccinate synthase/intein/homing endonuclease